MDCSPNLEQLKNQAKDLLRAFRADDPLARKRVMMHLPQVNLPPQRGARDLLLADALLVVARENGYPSWPKLKSQVEAGQGTWTGALSGQSGLNWRKPLVAELALQTLLKQEMDRTILRYARRALHRCGAFDSNWPPPRPRWGAEGFSQ